MPFRVDEQSQSDLSVQEQRPLKPGPKKINGDAITDMLLILAGLGCLISWAVGAAHAVGTEQWSYSLKEGLAIAGLVCFITGIGSAIIKRGLRS